MINLKLKQIQKNTPTLKKQLNNTIKILQHRQIHIKNPNIHTQIATTLTTVNQYNDLLTLYQQNNEINNHLQTLTQNNIAQFTQFNNEINQLIDTIKLHNQHKLTHLKKTNTHKQYNLLLLKIISLYTLILIL